MVRRTPTLEMISTLSRDDWERLCNLICLTLFSSHRVEDRHGKGNGLDAWRYVENGVEGWQFRRFDGRLGLNQTTHIRESILLAQKSCPAEMNKPLVKYNLIFNIDPEPGHQGQKGEIERLTEILKWAKSEFNMEFNFFGVSWVHNQLLKNPHLMPGLFEDIQSALFETKNAILDEVFSVKAELHKLLQEDDLKPKLDRVIRKVIEEATKHFERGMKYESIEDYKSAIVSLEDAVRLIEGEGLNAELEGKILMILSGVQALTGHLSSSMNNAGKAIELLKGLSDNKYLLFSKGNLAFSSYLAQKYDVAENLFKDILVEFERQGTLVEIVRTLSHLVELNALRNRFNEAFKYAERTKSAVKSLDKVIGISDYSISAMGAVANALSAFGSSAESPLHRKALMDAIETYIHIEEISEGVGLFRMKLGSKFGRARCVWNLDQLQDAEKLFREVSDEAKMDLPKLSTDALFNIALILIEVDRLHESRELLVSARKSYQELGDFSSVEDVDNVIARNFAA